jgi:hypothetical protein
LKENELFASSLPDDVLRIVLTDGPEMVFIPGVFSTFFRSDRPLPLIPLLGEVPFSEGLKIPLQALYIDQGQVSGLEPPCREG